MEPSSGSSNPVHVVDNSNISAETSTFPLLSLTDELLLEMFSLLPPDDLFSLGFVCQYSRQLVKDRHLGLKEKLLDLVLVCVDKQDYDGALVRLNAMKRLFPFWGEIWKERGLCWKDKGLIKRAIKSLRIARTDIKFLENYTSICVVRLFYISNELHSFMVQLTEDWSSKLGLTAQIRWIQDRHSASHRLINACCKMNPTNPKFFHFRAFIQSCLSASSNDQHSLNLELADYKTVLDIHHRVTPYKRLAIVYNNMGYVYYEKENHDEALEHYDRSLSVCPYHVRAFYNRSLVRQEFGHFSKAIADVDKILAINPNLREVYSLRGWSNVSRGRYAEAAADYGNSLPRTSSLDNVVSAYLDILVCIGQIEEAMEQSYKLYEKNKELMDGYTLRRQARIERIHEGYPDPDDDNASDDEEWLETATQNYAKQQRGEPLPDASGVKYVDINDEIDDYEVTTKKASEIQRTLGLLRRMRGELYLLEGQWLLARQLHTEQFKSTSHGIEDAGATATTPTPALDPPNHPAAPSTGSTSSSYLDLVFTSKNAPQREMVSQEVVDLTKKLVRECNVPNIRGYLPELMKDEKILSFKFNNVEESLYYASAFAYKYLALYLPNSAHLVRSCQLLERFWIAIRTLPIADSTNASQAILSPCVILTCLKLFKRSDGATNLQFLFTIIPGFGSKRNSHLPWVEFIKAVASFFSSRLEEGADSEDEDVEGDEPATDDDDEDDDGNEEEEGEYESAEDGGHEVGPLLSEETEIQEEDTDDDDTAE